MAAQKLLGVMFMSILTVLFKLSLGHCKFQQKMSAQNNTACPVYRYTKIHAYVLVPRSFVKFMFSKLYRVTQKDFYARPYTSVWAAVVARQISKRYPCSCHVFISTWAVISSTASMIRCLKSASSRTFLLYKTSLINPHAKKSNVVKSGDLEGQAVGPSAYSTTHADKHVARAWILFRYLSSYNSCPHWSVRTCIKSFWFTLYTVENINFMKLLGTKT